LTVESLGEEIPDGRQPDASEKKCSEPVKRRKEQNQELDPHASDPLAVDLARNCDRLIGVCGTAEIEEELCRFPQFSARKEKIARIFGISSGPPP
jgi:hypothetical protein